MSNKAEKEANKVRSLAFQKIVNVNSELTFRNALLEAELEVMKETAMRDHMAKEDPEEAPEQ